MTTKRVKRDFEGWDDVPMGGPEDDGGPVAIVRTAEGKAVVVPGTVTRLRGEALWAFGRVELAALKRAEAQLEIEAGVHAARAQGVSWAALGWAVGTTGEAARKRWGVDDQGDDGA